MRTIIVLLTLVGIAASAKSKTIELTCKFPNFENPLRYIFDDINGNAFLIGNTGLSPVVVHSGNAAISFIENVKSGAVQTTSVKLDDLIAVHSRNSIIGMEFSQSQVLGKCEQQVKP